MDGEGTIRGWPWGVLATNREMKEARSIIRRGAWRESFPHTKAKPSEPASLSIVRQHRYIHTQYDMIPPCRGESSSWWYTRLVLQGRRCAEHRHLSVSPAARAGRNIWFWPCATTRCTSVNWWVYMLLVRCGILRPRPWYSGSIQQVSRIGSCSVDVYTTTCTSTYYSSNRAPSRSMVLIPRF